MATPNKTQVAVKTKTEVATPPSSQVPDYVRAMGATSSGLKGMDASDFVIPRVVLLQALSKQVTAFDEAKPKKFWMTVMDKPMGDTIDIIVCSNRKRYLLMPPMGQPGGIFARAEDGKTWVPPKGEWSVKMPNVKDPVKWRITDPSVRGSGLAEFGSSIPGDPDSKPAATLFYDYLVYLPEHPELSPCVVSMARSQAKKAREMNGKIEFRKAPMQTQRFRLSPIDDKNPQGQEFYNLAVAYNGWATEEEHATCMSISERYGSYRIADEEEQAAEEAASEAPKERGDL